MILCTLFFLTNLFTGLLVKSQTDHTIKSFLVPRI